MKQKNYLDIAKRIQTLRTEAGFSSPEKLERKILISASTLRRIEKTGKIKEGSETEKKLADFFGVSVSYIRGETEYGNYRMQRTQVKSVYDSVMDSLASIGYKIDNCGIFENLDSSPYYKPASADSIDNDADNRKAKQKKRKKSVSYSNDLIPIFRISKNQETLCYVDAYEINLLTESIKNYMISQIELMAKYRNIDSVDFDTILSGETIFLTMKDLIDPNKK